MAAAEQEGLPFLVSAAPIFDDKAERSSAFVETPVFERAELVEPGGRQNCRANSLGICCQPIGLAYYIEHGPSGEMGNETEDSPNCEIADHDERQQPKAIGSLRGQSPKDIEQRQGRREHHCGQHQNQPPTNSTPVKVSPPPCSARHSLLAIASSVHLP